MNARRFARWLFLRLATRCIRKPDLVVGDRQMLRWHLIRRNSVFNVYLHHFLHSDDDGALHDHAYFNLSFVLVGDYVEHTIRAGGAHRRKLYKAGDWKLRSPWRAHRIEVHEGRTCWSLFITGPRLRTWGFHCPDGWRPYQLYRSKGCR